jgi:hypothetical protein
MKKILYLICLLTSCWNEVAAQIILCPLDTQAIPLKGNYVDYTTLFDAADVSFLMKTQQFTKKVLYFVTTESVSSKSKVNFFYQLYVSKEGAVQGFSYSFSGGDLKITDEQQRSLKAKIEAYAKNTLIDVKAKKNWQLTGMATMPKMESKRFYKDYLSPNPEPSAPQNTKLGLIQRLGNQCTTIWEKEGGRRPSELKFLGLVNVCQFNLKLSNPLFAQLRELTPTESVDSIYRQIFMYMYEKCPIVAAKYGYYGNYLPIYDRFGKAACDCLMSEYPVKRGKSLDEDDEIFYAAAESCEVDAGKTLDTELMAVRDSIMKAAERNNEYQEVAVNVFAGGLVAYGSLHCPYRMSRWADNFVRQVKLDSMIHLYWSEKRQARASRIFECLATKTPNELKDSYKTSALFQQNQDQIQKLLAQFKEAGLQNPGLVLSEQRVTKEAYIETVQVKEDTEIRFQFKIYYDIADGATQILRLEYIPKIAKVNLPQTIKRGK